MASQSGKRKRSATSQPLAFNMCSKGFGLIYRGMSHHFFVMYTWYAHKPSMHKQGKIISSNLKLWMPVSLEMKKGCGYSRQIYTSSVPGWHTSCSLPLVWCWNLNIQIISEIISYLFSKILHKHGNNWMHPQPANFQISQRILNYSQHIAKDLSSIAIWS